MAGKQFYDRDDLDEEEQKLFDEMVLEEMEKLENQFKNSSIEEQREQEEFKSSHSRIESENYSRDYDHAPQPRISEYPSDNSSYRIDHPSDNNDNTRRGAQEPPARRVSRTSVVVESHPQSQYESMPFTQDKSVLEKKQGQLDYASILKLDTQIPLENGERVPIRNRRAVSPELRMDNNMMNCIGSTSIKSPDQKRAQQAKYAQQLAEGSSRTKDLYREQERLPARRQPVDNSIDDVNIISSIGQNSELLKDKKKLQQQKYAQQLLNQQQEKQYQNSKFYSDRESPKSNTEYNRDNKGSALGLSSSPYDKRINNDYDTGSNKNSSNNSNSVNSSNSVVNFGRDPETESALKREKKLAYARQLDEQQYNEQYSKSKYADSPSGNRGGDNRGDRSNAHQPFDTRGYNRDDNGGYSDRNIDRNNDTNNIPPLSATELKRMQQRQYYDEITRAAQAPEISSERTSLSSVKGESASRQQNIEAKQYQNQGTGLQLNIGKSTTTLSTADIDKLESRARKMQLQQKYAQQLLDDANVNGANRGGSIPTGSSSNMNSCSDNRRRGGDMFDSMSNNINSLDTLTRKQAEDKQEEEYYQRAQEEQQYQSNYEGSGNGRMDPSERDYARQREGQREREGQGGYQGQRMVSSSREPENAYSARRKQQDEYATALNSDSRMKPIEESYTAQRRSHHERQIDSDKREDTKRESARDRDRGYNSSGISNSNSSYRQDDVGSYNDTSSNRGYQANGSSYPINSQNQNEGYYEKHNTQYESNTRGDRGNKGGTQSQPHSTRPYDSHSSHMGDERGTGNGKEDERYNSLLSPGQKYKSQHLFGSDTSPTTNDTSGGHNGNSSGGYVSANSGGQGQGYTSSPSLLASASSSAYPVAGTASGSSSNRGRGSNSGGGKTSFSFY